MSSSTLRQPTCCNAHESSGKRLRPGTPGGPNPGALAIPPGPSHLTCGDPYLEQSYPRTDIVDCVMAAPFRQKTSWRDQRCRKLAAAPFK
jgi:hypothetical protein